MKRVVAVCRRICCACDHGIPAAGQASSDNGTLDVSGNTYAQAVKILKSQGYKAGVSAARSAVMSRNRSASSKVRRFCRWLG